jgi:hypothetical protein
MSPEISRDGTVLLQALLAPSRGLPEAAARRRPLAALAVSTAAALVFAAVAVPRIDFERAAAARIDARPNAAEMTPHEREDALTQERRIDAVSAWAGAALGPVLLSLGAAGALWLAFRVAGSRPGFRSTFAVAAHGLLPVRLAPLLAIPALVAKAPVRVEEVGRLLPSSLAALLPAAAAPPLAAALTALDLFSLWSVVLVSSGMARAAGTTRARAIAVTLLLFVAWVAIFRVAIPAASAGGPRG